MGTFSTYYRNKVLDHMLRGVSFTPPGTIYLAAFTSNNGLQSNAPTGEVVGGAYSRQAVSLTLAANGSTENSVQISFPKASAGWGSVTSLAIVDHATNANWGANVNVLAWADLSAAREILANDRLVIDAQDLDITMS